MANTQRSVCTALLLIGLSAAVFVGRRATLGAEEERPQGDSAWAVTWLVRGELGPQQTAVRTALPPDFRHQHITEERAQSEDLRAPTGKKGSPDRHELVWQRLGMRGGARPYRLTYSFQCVLGVRRPTRSMAELTRALDAVPASDCLRPAPHVESDHPDVYEKARALTGDGMAAVDQVQALFHHVAHEVANEPALGPRVGALDCLRHGRGDPGAKSRLLVALCRNRGIPARLVSGLVLVADQQQTLHHWAEAHVNGHWLPMCPTYAHFDARDFPKNYLVLQVGGDDLVRGGRGGQHHGGFLVRALQGTGAEEPPASGARAFWQNFSFAALRPGDQHLVRFLLLLPLAALIVSLYRTLIGIPTFGTFGAALLGLAFLDVKALPWGLGIFVLTALAGWLLRRVLDRFHLLLVPRTAVLLTLLVALLLGVIRIASQHGVPVTHYVALFPLVILTHLVERFWTVEAEDGTAASFKTLLGTLVVAVTISLTLSPDAVSAWMFRHPETLGAVVGVLFLLGRYTGYRLTELYRFADLIENRAPAETKV